MQPIIFVDLDGVLVDLKKRLLEISNKPKEYLSKSTLTVLFYEIIREMNENERIEFWSNLDMKENALDFWNFLSGWQPLILTSVSGCQAAVVGKKIWCENNLKIDPNRVFCSRKSTEKQFYASPKTILIDDYENNIKEFRAKGGHGILFEDNEQAKSELLELFKNNGFFFGSKDE